MTMLSRIAIPRQAVNGALDRLPNGVWRLWLHTPNFVHGTYLLLYPNGSVDKVTTRDEEGDDIIHIKEAD